MCKQAVEEKDVGPSKPPVKEANVESDKLPIHEERAHDVIGGVGAVEVIDIDELGTETLRSPLMVLSLLLKSPLYILIDGGISS